MKSPLLHPSMQAKHSERLGEAELRAQAAEALAARRQAELQAANTQLHSQAAHLAVS